MINRAAAGSFFARGWFWLGLAVLAVVVAVVDFLSANARARETAKIVANPQNQGKRIIYALNRAKGRVKSASKITRPQHHRREMAFLLAFLPNFRA